MHCKTCKYWAETNLSRPHRYEKWGFCHRYPPVGQDSADYIMQRPLVAETAWCGEFNAKD